MLTGLASRVNVSYTTTYVDIGAMSSSRMMHATVFLLCVFIYNSNFVDAASDAATLNDESLTRLLNSKADPCANFYQYVCGSSRKNSSRLELSPLAGSFQARWLEVQKDISSLLEMPDNVGSRHAEKVRIAYNSCMKEDSARDVDSLKDLLSDYGISDWPARSGSTEEVYDGGVDMSLPELEAFFHYDVVQDKQDKSRRMLSVYRASLPVLYGSVLASNKDPEDGKPQSLERERAPQSRENQGEPTDGIQEGARNGLNSSGSNAGNDNESTGQDFGSSERRVVQEYEVYVKSVVKSMNRLSSIESTELAKEIIRFEVKLAEVARADTGAKRKTAIYTSLRRLNKEYPTISLSTYFLERHLRKRGITLQYDTQIYIAEPAYVENVFALLRKTRRYQVKNYVGWRIIATLAPFVSPLRAHHQKFMAQYGFHEKRKQEICMESIAANESPMRPLVGKMYVERKFSPEAKQHVQLMSELIQRELVTSLSNVRWTTHHARKTALKAVTEMTILIGYPDCMDNEDTFQGFLSNGGNFTEQSPFVRIYEAYRMAAFEDLMKKLSTPYSASNEWSVAPTDVTFGYDASSNTIYLPAGALRPPLYSLKYPRAGNYGTVGVMIAREMARALHAPDLQSVGDKSTCSKITLDEYYEINPLCRKVVNRDDDNFNSDEEPFLEDNGDSEEEVLDEIALTVAWKAFLNHSKRSRGYRNSEDIEEGSRQEKRFFISAGVFVCTMLTEYDIRQCETGGTTDCRINRLTKIPQFREAFQCNGV